MSDEVVIDGIVALLPPLLQSLEALAYVSRYLHPPEFGELMQLVGHPDAALRQQLGQLSTWPNAAVHLRDPLRIASEHALAAFGGLRTVASGRGELVEVFGALRHLPQALEALYPLTAVLPPIATFFLGPDLSSDATLEARLAQPKHPDSGLFHHVNGLDQRGGFSLYVPEDYTPERAWPLVMALHGGAGHGRLFLWSWLRDARSRGAIVVAPTAFGRTWALMGDDIDTPNLSRILTQIAGGWHIDASRLLLTGFSDGATFCYLSGLDNESPFTHLAPLSASFHPLLAGMADAARMRALPIQIVHGVHDWMFPVELARQARDALFAAGADVSYREIADLSHSYPREINAELLAWFGGTPRI